MPKLVNCSSSDIVITSLTNVGSTIHLLSEGGSMSASVLMNKAPYFHFFNDILSMVYLLVGEVKFKRSSTIPQHKNKIFLMLMYLMLAVVD